MKGRLEALDRNLWKDPALTLVNDITICNPAAVLLLFGLFPYNIYAEERIHVNKEGLWGLLPQYAT